MPIAERPRSHVFSRAPPEREGRGGIASPAGGHTTGYQPHAPPGRCSSAFAQGSAGYSDSPLEERTERNFFSCRLFVIGKRERYA